VKVPSAKPSKSLYRQPEPNSQAQRLDQRIVLDRPGIAIDYLLGEPGGDDSPSDRVGCEHGSLSARVGSNCRAPGCRTCNRKEARERRRHAPLKRSS